MKARIQHMIRMHRIRKGTRDAQRRWKADNKVRNSRRPLVPPAITYDGAGYPKITDEARAESEYVSRIITG